MKNKLSYILIFTFLISMMSNVVSCFWKQFEDYIGIKLPFELNQFINYEINYQDNYTNIDPCCDDYLYKNTISSSIKPFLEYVYWGEMAYKYNPKAEVDFILDENETYAIVKNKMTYIEDGVEKILEYNFYAYWVKLGYFTIVGSDQYHHAFGNYSRRFFDYLEFIEELKRDKINL